MKAPMLCAALLMTGALFAPQAFADGDFQSHLASCVEKFADPAQSASVMLDCNAQGGKLSDCKVADNSAPSDGFGKAAICVASFLPIGSKTGATRVPIRFAGS